jgi:hypothetical protein
MTIRISMVGAEALELYPESRARFSRQIAEELLRLYGAFAHIHALEALESRHQEHAQKLWRDVLTTLDEITNERKQDDSTKLRTAEEDKPD